MGSLPVIVAVDVGYGDPDARAAAVAFREWTDATPSGEWVVPIAGESLPPYVPGEFFRRELPCLLAVLERVPRPIGCVVVDGHVWLGVDRPGLGARLHSALGAEIPVLGVAKAPFRGSPAILVHRGSSARPLFVTAAGVDPDAASEWIRNMHGDFRIPTLLRRVDQLTRNLTVS